MSAIIHATPDDLQPGEHFIIVEFKTRHIDDGYGGHAEVLPHILRFPDRKTWEAEVQRRTTTTHTGYGEAPRWVPMAAMVPAVKATVTVG